MYYATFRDKEPNHQQQRPETSHLSLLPPCKVTGNLNYLSDCRYTLLCNILNLKTHIHGHADRLLLIPKRVMQLAVTHRCRRYGCRGFDAACSIGCDVIDTLIRQAHMHSVAYLHDALTHLYTHAIRGSGSEMSAWTTGESRQHDEYGYQATHYARSECR